MSLGFKVRDKEQEVNDAGQDAEPQRRGAQSEGEILISILPIIHKVKLYLAPVLGFFRLSHFEEAYFFMSSLLTTRSLVCLTKAERKSSKCRPHDPALCSTQCFAY